MAKISLWQKTHGVDFKFFDRNIKEQFYQSGVDIYVHKYLGPPTSDTASGDATQPSYTNESEKNIQDLLFIENRDRKYDPDIYEIRGHYNVGNTDFSLAAFGLFIQNDTLFITFHINDMIDRLGRKLMAGDVFEMPNLVDYWSLDESFPIALKKFYVVDEATRASEGYSPTWWPHLWRCKVVPMVNAQEFQDIIKQQNAQLQTVKGGAGFDINDLLSSINSQLAINDAVVNEAIANVPKSGYDTSLYYVEPENTALSNELQNDLVAYDLQNADIHALSDQMTPTYNMPGYLTGDAEAPNGWPVTALTYFPETAQIGSYVLRLDFQPNQLFRYSGKTWTKVNDVQRANFGGSANETQYDSFINNRNKTVIGINKTINEKQALSEIFSNRQKPITHTVINTITLMAEQGTETTATLPANYASNFAGGVVPMALTEMTVTTPGTQTIAIPVGYQFYKWSLRDIAQKGSDVTVNGSSLTISTADGINAGDFIVVEFVPITS
jgi:hypothetical protein